MAQQRPTLILVTAILNMVFGGIGLVCGACGLAGNVFTMFLATNNPVGAQVFEMYETLEKEIPGYRVIELSHLGLIIFLSIVLVVAGIGLLSMASWARWLTIAYGVFFFLLQVLYLIYQLALLQPAMARWQQQALGMPANPYTNVGGWMGAVLGTALYVAYGLVAIGLMLFPGVAAAFARSARTSDDSDDHDR